MNLHSTGTEANGDSSYQPSISADGRFVAFTSNASSLVANDTNNSPDVFVRDLLSGTTERVSVSMAGSQGTYGGGRPSISADARFVAFESFSPNLVSGDTNGIDDIFVRDRLLGTTKRISLSTGGAQGNGYSLQAAISADGRFVAFWGGATNLVTGDTNGTEDVFVRDRDADGDGIYDEPGAVATTRVSVDTGGVQGNWESKSPSLSADGRFVAFHSNSPLTAGDVNGFTDIFVRDRDIDMDGIFDEAGAVATELVSVGWGGVQGNSFSENASISAEGRYVAFESFSTNLVTGDTNQKDDVFVHDRQLGTTERASVDSSGQEGTAHSGGPWISADGRVVGFWSDCSSLSLGDTNGATDVFLRDRLQATTERVSVGSSGLQGDNASGFYGVSLSADGRFVSFLSYATNLVAGDTNGFSDVFRRDRASTPGVDICQPGSGSVLPCPCTNPPLNAPRGCENSAATGGARLISNGSASLSSDSVVFTTNGETLTATSIVLQGSVEITNGVAFGQGVRCAGGGLKRLFVKTAAGGSITAPESGDPSVSARSAVLGDTISAGTDRWYAVYYRDPNVMGFCPATITFNITQTQRVGWAP